jgi:arylsulfatase
MPDIAVVVLDTLRKDSFDRHFDWLPGTRFDETYAPSHYTVPVHAGLFTGQYPSAIGVGAKNERFDCPEPSLVELLRDAGYTTEAFSANGLLTARQNFDRGFDRFDTSWYVELMDDDVFGWSQAAKRLPNGPLRDLRAVVECLRSDCDVVRSLKLGYRQKFADHDGGRQVLSNAREGRYDATNFLFVNLMEAHSPYRSPSEYDMPSASSVDPQTVLEGDVNLSDRRAQYEVAVRWLSDLYRDIFEEIRSEFDYVITLSDHGELFGEHGARAHFHGVYPELVHVPLCVTGLEEENCVTDEPRSLLDVHKTIAELAGVSVESEGVDLRDSPGTRDRFVEYHGFRQLRLESLRERGFSDDEIDVFDTPLVGHVSSDSEYAYQWIDPEGTQLESTDPDDQTLKEYRETVESRISEMTRSSETVSESTREQLRKLGYA